MYTSNSGSQWGSPDAPRKALLIHGLAMCSSSWEGIAQLLVAEGQVLRYHAYDALFSTSFTGFFVVAPNLLGHAWRRCTDYRVSTLTEDLRPYFIKDTSYDVIVGHYLGGLVALSLLSFLPKMKETAVILLDPPPLEIEETIEMHKSWFLNEVANIGSTEEQVDLGWSQRDRVLYALGFSMCNSTTINGVFLHNRPWSFSGLFKNIPPHVTITVLVSDPQVGAVCRAEHVPRGIEKLNVRVLPGIGHCIHWECPDAIVDLIRLPRAKL
ncbi:Alpha/Beta hydrolase protein [Suillus bovinus]|uniref:Alpha/Beta hydrolase protein n=1 Tax=Suillus bovinus TaxID=48563 RepID=UPI001B880F31|nr:Alpha/Beta hydrolase protein [Suillus bovinus]KAG2141438.1 Alpha/Beta hydrolase protein [Suillus bovinus]